LLLDRNAPEWIHGICRTDVKDPVPSAHEDGEPAHLDNAGAIVARKKCIGYTDCEAKIIQRPDAKDAAYVELLDMNGACGLTFAQQ
jgi:hypothetical protein